MSKWRKIWGYIKEGATVWTILQLIGIPQIVLGSIMAIFLSIYSYFMNIPTPYIIIIVLLGSTSIVWLINGLIWAKSKKPIKKISEQKTMILLSKPHSNATYWDMGSTKGKPAMHIMGEFTVTNIAKFSILPILSKMREPKTLGGVSTRNIYESGNVYGRYHIPEEITTDLQYHFWIMPPFKEKGESFKADIAIIDQFGNEHWIEKIEFSYH